MNYTALQQEMLLLFQELAYHKQVTMRKASHCILLGMTTTLLL